MYSPSVATEIPSPNLAGALLLVHQNVCVGLLVQDPELPGEDGQRDAPLGHEQRHDGGEVEVVSDVVNGEVVHGCAVHSRNRDVCDGGGNGGEGQPDAEVDSKLEFSCTVEEIKLRYSIAVEFYVLLLPFRTFKTFSMSPT